MGKAEELREQALEALTKAKAMTGEDGELLPGVEEGEFDAAMAEFRDLDAKAGKAQSHGDAGALLQERFAYYTAKTTGQAVPFSVRRIAGSPGVSLGQAFIASDEYRDLLGSGVLSSDSSKQAFRSRPFSAAATDVIQSTPSTGPGSALVTPEYLPGVVPLRQRPLVIRQLFGQGTTQSDTVSYAQQTSFDSGASAVAQAVSAVTGAKPQSSIGWTRKTSPVETIATWMAVTRQQLADAGQVQALIDVQGRIMLELEEEEQLLNGDGTSPNLSGIYDQSIQTLNVEGTTSPGDRNIDAVRRAMRLVKTGISRLTADALVMNPIDSAEMDLSTDGFGQYRLGGPFSTDASGQPRPVWGLTRVESEAIAVGKALVGAFQAGATVLERQGITVLTADQHADFFVRNLVVILFEERLGFPVYFPSAFVDIDLGAWPSGVGS